MRAWRLSKVLALITMAVFSAAGCKASRGGTDLSEAHGAGHGGHGDIYADQTAWTGSCPKGLDPGNYMQRQSPIALDLAAFKTRSGDIALNYAEADAKLVDNGHTVQVSFPDGSQTLTFEENTYTLRQFHMHRLSEHVVTAGSGQRRYAMEVHFVHTRPALGPDDKSTAVALGFFVEEGAENTELERLWSHVPEDLGSDDVWQINIGNMIPRGSEYLVYEGSLTTPPCDEIVTHAVATTPMTMSAGQIKRFSDLYARNNRVLQPQGDATVRRFRAAREAQ